MSNDSNKVQSVYKVVIQLEDSEQEKLVQFKQMIQKEQLWDQQFDDPYLIRFLKARKFDIQQTILMWKSFITWRKENQVDQINSFEFNEVDYIRKYYPHGYQGNDKLGRPIYIERIGKIQYKEIFGVTSDDRMVKYYTQGYENLIKNIFPKCQQKFQKNVLQTCIILDLAGISMTLFNKKVKSLIQLASKIAQDNYPEVLGAMYIVNAPYLFSTIWGAVKIFIDKKTQAKVKILGSDYGKVLNEIIDKDQLPNFLGGTQPDLLSRNQGVWNPLGLEFFGSKDDIKQKNDDILNGQQSQKNLDIKDTQNISNDQENQNIDQNLNEQGLVDGHENFDIEISSINNVNQSDEKKSIYHVKEQNISKVSQSL